VFPERTLSDLLGRMSTMAGQLAELLARTPRTSLDAVTGDRDEDFRTRYLDFVAARLDRLELREPVPGRLDFVHRTFQEYLAASEATEDEHIDPLIAHSHLDSWWETIVMACGHAKRPQVRDLLNGILDRADRESQHARRLRLLAAACLETVPDVDPEALARVEEIIQTKLVPPRSARETQSLATIGHRLLRYLPSSLEELTEASAAATVRAAGLAGNREALSALAAYAKDTRHAVQSELIDCWDYFDPERYAREVLADAPLLNGLIEIKHLRYLSQLQHINRISQVSVFLNVAEQVNDLQAIGGIEHLVGVRAYTTRRRIDLRPLAGIERGTQQDQRLRGDRGDLSSTDNALPRRSADRQHRRSGVTPPDATRHHQVPGHGSDSAGRKESRPEPYGRTALSRARPTRTRQ
jgi:hypothetical protein